MGWLTVSTFFMGFACACIFLGIIGSIIPSTKQTYQNCRIYQTADYCVKAMGWEAK